MIRKKTLVAVNLLLFLTFSPAIAQRGGPSRGDGQSRGGGQVPAPGTMLPAVSAFDEQGEKFSTASLRGSYTVLVFGCLT